MDYANEKNIPVGPPALPAGRSDEQAGEQIAEIIQKLINVGVVVLAFLLPLFFLPVTTEFFEFNKLGLLTGAVILGTLACGIKCIALGNITFKRAPFDLPIIFFWTVTLVATVFSEHLPTSLAGHYGRWHPSLATVTVFTTLYFLLTNNLEQRALKYIGYALLGSAVFSTFLFLPQYFGQNLFGQDWSSSKAFTPLGSLANLAIFLGATFPFALREAIIRSKRELKLIALGVALILLFTLTLLNIIAGWVALAVAVAFSLSGVKFTVIKQSWLYLLTTVIALVVFATVLLVPSIRNLTPFGPAGEGPREIGLDLRTSWSVSATSFRQRPFYGSGPGTFLFDFTRYKPLSYNYTPFWSVRFDKPLSEYLLIFAEMGLPGVLAYLFLIAVLIRTIGKAKSKKFLPLGAGILGGFFIASSTITTWFLLALALASVGEFTKPPTTGKHIPTRIGQNRKGLATLGLAALLVASLSYGLYRTYAAEVSHYQAVQAFRRSQISFDRQIEELQNSYNHQLQAVQHFPWRDQYHAVLAQISFTWANAFAGRTDITDEVRSTNVQLLVARAIDEAKKASQLSPLNVNNWEMLAQTYRNLIGFAQDVETAAVNSYLQAINHDPFNPLLRVELGGLFYQMDNYEQAIDQFLAAVNLKNNYANAYYNLGVTYKETGKISDAIDAIETALRLSPQNTPGYQEAEALLEQLKQQQSQEPFDSAQDEPGAISQ